MPSKWTATSRHADFRDMLRDIWAYRGMLVFLGWKVLRRMYRRTVLGWLWLFIQPLFPLALQTLVFGGLLNVSSDGIPYFLFLSAGSLVWTLFSQGLMWGTRGLEMNRNLIGVAYMPRAIFPLGNMSPAFFDLGIRGIVLVLTVVAHVVVNGHLYVAFGPQLLLGAGALVGAFVLAVGLSMFTSLWGETARDMRYSLGQLLPVWFVLTPVLYPLSSVPANYRAWMMFNPMTPFVETFRWSLLGVGEYDGGLFAMAWAISVLLMVAGFSYFARADRQAAEAR